MVHFLHWDDHDLVYNLFPWILKYTIKSYIYNSCKNEAHSFLFVCLIDSGPYAFQVNPKVI